MEQLSGQSAPVKPERKVTSLQIAGIPVEFPFEPYPCQRDFMESVITALQQGKNALLESPTGTGKTLCLLCSTLAWRESLKPPTPDPNAAAAAALAQQAGGAFGGLGVGSGVAPIPGLAGQGQGPGQAAAGAPRPDLPLIIYSSRTHSQLAQVMKELRNSSYKDRVRSTVLSSRQQTCLHPTASKLSGGAANQACKALTSAKKCSWHNQLKFGKYRNAASSLVSPVPDIEELVATGKAHGVCPFYLGRDAGKEADIVFLPYNYLLDPSTRRTMADNINWNNAVVIFDEAHNVESVSSDACSFDITAKQLTDAMLEAKRCKEACLERIERGMVAMVDVAAPGETAGPDYRRLAADMDLLLAVLKTLENGLHALAAKLPPPPTSGYGGGEASGLTRPGSFLFEFLGQFGITSHSMSALNAAIDSAADILAAADVEAGRTTSKTSTVALQHLQSCLNLAFSTLEPLTDQRGAPPAHKGFRVHVHLQRSWGADKLPAPTLSYWCFIPGMAFRRLAALQLRSFLLTSGTLSPMDSFAAELQLPFPMRLENPHVIAANQVWVGVLPTGPSGVALNSTYASRDSTAYKDELGNALVNVARLVPDGLLVFFASYAAMDSAINHWKQNGGAGGVGSTWERIIRHKAPVVEPRESSAFGAAIEEFRSKLDDPATQGAVFFAVCRGKVSEGLDFSDRAGRAVVITGIPYAVKTDPKVRLKRDVLDEEARAIASGAGLAGAGEGITALNGEAWYTNTAMRAVNQAMGRVIRHRWDYGAILLADDRFRHPGTQRNMSRWVREHVVVYEHFGKASASLTKFFKDKAGFKAPNKGLPGRSTALSAFETVGKTGAVSAAMVPASLGGASGSGDGRGGISLLDSAPAAIDVSGIGALAATGLGRSCRAAKPMAAAAAAPVGGGGRATGGLLGLLRSAPAAADAAPEPAPSVALAGATNPRAGETIEDGADGSTARASTGSIGLSAALETLGGGQQAAGQASGAAAGGIRPPAPSGSGVSRPGLPLPRAPPPLSMLALASGVAAAGPSAQLAPLGTLQTSNCFGGGDPGGAGSAAVEVVGPQHKLAELRRRAAASQGGSQSGHEGPSAAGSLQSGVAAAAVGEEEDPVADLLREEDPGAQTRSGAGGRTAGGLTRIVLAGPEQRSGREASRSGGGGAESGTAETGVGTVNADSGQLAGTSASGDAAQAAAVAKADPKAFMVQLKSDLSPQAFKEFQRLMSAYKSTKDLTAFVDGAVLLLRGATTCHLLRGVAAFMPKSEREWFNKVIEVHVRAAADTPASAAAVPQGQPAAKPSIPSASGQGTSATAAAGRCAAASSSHARAGVPGGEPGPAAASHSGRGNAGGSSSAAGAGAVKTALGKRPPLSDAAAEASAQGAGDHAKLGQASQPSQSRAGAPKGASIPKINRSGASAAAAALDTALASVGGNQIRSQLSRPPPSVGNDTAAAMRAAERGADMPLGGGSKASQVKQPRQQPQSAPLPDYVGAYGPSNGARSEAVLHEPPAKRLNVGPSAPSGTGGSSAGGGSLGGVSRPTTGAGPAGGVLSAAAAAASCSLCGKRPMQNAHEGPCGHLACYNCWLVQLAVHFKCKTCGRGMRQKNLTKKYFM